MKNRNKFLGMIAVVAVLGFFFITSASQVHSQTYISETDNNEAEEITLVEQPKNFRELLDLFPQPQRAVLQNSVGARTFTRLYQQFIDHGGCDAEFVLRINQGLDQILERRSNPSTWGMFRRTAIIRNALFYVEVQTSI